MMFFLVNFNLLVALVKNRKYWMESQMIILMHNTICLLKFREKLSKFSNSKNYLNVTKT